MSDKELLELAAKAAGIKSRGFFVSEPDGTGQLLGLVIDEHETRWWNPLRHDGDALRLAIKLKINIQFSGNRFNVSPHQVLDICCLFEGEDEAMEIRRAIVRAAAGIGRGLYGQ